MTPTSTGTVLQAPRLSKNTPTHHHSSRWGPLLLAGALVLAPAGANAGLLKKLFLGAALASGAATAVHHAKMQSARTVDAANAATGARMGRLAWYNNENKKRFEDVIHRSQRVRRGPGTIGVEDALCGPAALYATLGAAAPTGSFSDWVTLLRQTHTLKEGPIIRGMQTKDLQAAIRLQGIKSDVFRFDLKEDAAFRAIDALDQGKAVFAEVDADESRRALSGEPMAPGRHYVGVVAAIRNQAGTVTHVGIYDVNVFNGEVPVGAWRYVDYKTFAELLRFRANAVFNALVITQTSVRPTVRL